MYIQPNGKIGRLLVNRTSTISDAIIENLSSASFSFDGQKILASFGDPNAPRYSVFDVINKSWQSLPVVVRAPRWSPNDHRIVFFSQGDSFVNLTTLDLDDARATPRTLLRIYAQDLVLYWPTPKVIILSEKTSFAVPGSLWALDTTTLQLKLVIDQFWGLASLWEGGEGRGLVFGAETARSAPHLSLYNTSGTKTDLTLLTLPHKCAFGRSEDLFSPSSTNKEGILVCGLPRKFSSDQGRLPDAYYRRATFLDDDFYAINLGSGEIRTLFADKNYTIDTAQIRITPEGVLVLDRYSNQVFLIAPTK